MLSALRFRPRRPRGLSLYQPLVVSGQTVARGRRDCEIRWQAIAPHLPASGAILDIGSNFGWFGLRACETSPERLVVSVEADEQSARMQKLVLASHGHQRIVLLTRKAGVAMARKFADHGQRFQAAFCFSVLHWIPDHAEFLRQLGGITDQLFIEHPDPREAGAGNDSIRRAIGPIGEYLRSVLPDKPATQIAELPSHRETPHPRQLWKVGEPANESSEASLDVQALLGLSPTWPQRSWWRQEVSRIAVDTTQSESSGGLELTTQGLARGRGKTSGGASLNSYRRRIASVPEDALFSRRDQLARFLRGIGRRLLRR
jgi:hypothetical protein